MTTSPISLQVQNVLGVRSKLDSGLFFVDEQTVIYSAGNQFILVDVETKSQRTFRCPELEYVKWLSVHSGTAVIAVVSSKMNGDKESTIISFYDLHNNLGKRKRTFDLRDAPMTIVSTAFSHDAKHLAILDGGYRDYTLSLWSWQKSRAIASMKLGQAEGVTLLSHVLFHPTDHNLISIVGRQFSRTARHLEGNLRLQPSSAKLDQYDFKTHAWYDSNRLLAGTNNGQICVMFNGDVQTEIDAIEGRERAATNIPRTLSTTSSAARSAIRSSLHQHQQEHLDTSRPTGNEVTSMCIVSKGFFCLIGGKRLCLFTKIGDSWDFAKTREYVIPEGSFGAPRSMTGNNQNTPSLVAADGRQHQQQPIGGHSMVKVAISPAEEHVLVLSNKQQIYAVSDMTRDQAVESREPFQLEFIFNSYHQSAIRGIDVSVQKPMFVSAGDDHTIRLWNYQTMSIEQIQYYNEPVYAIAFHPNGHQIVVAFASKVSLMNILIDGFSTLKEYPIHAAHNILFSNGGHLFAVIDSNIIQIISPVYLKVIHRLNHGQTVKEIMWKKNDLGLYSLSSNCFVIWNLINQTKVFEYKPTFRLDGGFAVDRDERYIYLASDDGHIRALYNGQIIHELKLPQDDRPSFLSSFSSNGALICGTHRGSIYVIKTPLSNAPAGNVFHYYAHSSKVTQIVVAFHEGLIISCCEDGVLMLWSTQLKHSVKSEDWTPVVLQNKTRFLSLSEMIKKLQDEVGEIKRNREYRLHQLETNYLADIQRRTTMSENERKHHENQIQRLNIEKEKEQHVFETKVAELKEKFDVDKQRIEEEDRSRMSREVHKEEELIRLSQKMMEDNEFRLKTTIEASENEIRDIVEFFTGKIRETENELNALRKKGRQMLEANETQKVNIEADVDDEILKLQVDFDQEKKSLLEQNQKLQKNFRETLEHQVRVLTAKQNQQDTQANKQKKVIHENTLLVQGMTQEISSLNHEIFERSQTIREKDDRINELELKNQELEKFKYVLRYKREELERLIRPREEEIDRMKTQLIGMASEKEKKETELTDSRFRNDGQRRTLHAIDDQVEKERRKRKEYEYTMRKIKTDLLAHFSDLTDSKRVQQAVIDLNDKYIVNEHTKNIYATGETSDGISEEAIAQDRQRLYLERTTADLKNKLNNDLHASKANRMRIMNENAMLLRELNNLREELKIIRDRIQDYEVAQQTSEARGIHSIDALIQTLNADAGNYAQRSRDHELNKEVEKNQREIHRLRQRLAQLQLNSEQFAFGTDLNDQSEEISIVRLT